MLPIHPPKLLRARTALVSSCCTSQIPFQRLFSTLPKQPAILSQWPWLHRVLCDLLGMWCQQHPLLKPLGSDGKSVTCNAAWVNPAFAYMMLLRGLNWGCMINYRKMRCASQSGPASLLREKHSYILTYVPATATSPRGWQGHKEGWQGVMLLHLWPEAPHPPQLPRGHFTLHQSSAKLQCHNAPQALSETAALLSYFMQYAVLI